MKKSVLVRCEAESEQEVEKPKWSQDHQLPPLELEESTSVAHECNCVQRSAEIITKFYEDNKEDFKKLSKLSDYNVIQTIHSNDEHFYNLIVLEKNYKKNSTNIENFSTYVQNRFKAWYNNGSHLCELEKLLENAKKVLNPMQLKISRKKVMEEVSSVKKLRPDPQKNDEGLSTQEALQITESLQVTNFVSAHGIRDVVDDISDSLEDIKLRGIKSKKGYTKAQEKHLEEEITIKAKSGTKVRHLLRQTDNLNYDELGSQEAKETFRKLNLPIPRKKSSTILKRLVTETKEKRHNLAAYQRKSFLAEDVILKQEVQEENMDEQKTVELFEENKHLKQELKVVTRSEKLMKLENERLKKEIENLQNQLYHFQIEQSNLSEELTTVLAENK